MKNLFLLIVITVISATNVFAQYGDYTLTREQEAKCTELTRAMVNELRLNEMEYIKLKALNREKIAAEDATRESLKDNVAALELKLQEIETDFETKLTAILNANQLQAFAEYKRKNTARHIAVSEVE
ncbi:hypothetical protein [uncultured Pontibacter sp.]|uniref:hypothetical protein n=1 Tax=uncultured Pontibacter sp. TaxID=453356 RepID=UPI002624B982|nr:hypothetical protein [uncultured Pontibacter sp.]